MALSAPPPSRHFAQIENSFKGIQQYKTLKSAPNNLARPLPPWPWKAHRQPGSKKKQPSKFTEFEAESPLKAKL